MHDLARGAEAPCAGIPNSVGSVSPVSPALLLSTSRRENRRESIAGLFLGVAGPEQRQIEVRQCIIIIQAE